MSRTTVFPPERSRNVYFQGRFLTAADFNREQDYFRSRRRHDHVYLHGWGVVHGLGLALHGEDGDLIVAAGAAIDADGLDLFVAQDRPLRWRPHRLVAEEQRVGSQQQASEPWVEEAFVCLRPDSGNRGMDELFPPIAGQASAEPAAIVVEAAEPFLATEHQDHHVVLGRVRCEAASVDGRRRCAYSLVPGWRRPLTLSRTWICRHSWPHGGRVSRGELQREPTLTIDCTQALAPVVDRHVGEVLLTRDDGSVVRLDRGLECDAASLRFQLDAARLAKGGLVRVRLHCGHVFDVHGAPIAGRPLPVPATDVPLATGAVFESWFATADKESS